MPEAIEVKLTTFQVGQIYFSNGSLESFLKIIHPNLRGTAEMGSYEFELVLPLLIRLIPTIGVSVPSRYGPLVFGKDSEGEFISSTSYNAKPYHFSTGGGSSLGDLIQRSPLGKMINDVKNLPDSIFNINND
jgi:hypothetical protein